ncbi:MAG: N-6 DNA methylase [Deltaproteobacteria bacterium]|nr:N-6 DNA methylase [Deltaproteobacteria bacterium]
MIHRLGLDELTPKASMLCDVRADEPMALLTFAELSAAPSANHPQQKAVSALLFKLLTAALRELLSSARLHRDDALSLVGRALFLRFLSTGPPPSAWGDDPGALFASSVSAQRASDWLDRTFNGDLLPLHAESWAALDPASLAPLRDILRGEPGGQLSLSWSEGWMHLHFGHIPVGVLSEVYERFIHEADPELAAASGVHYTPWRIAERLMAESFAALRRGGRAAEARVLDPAAGAGVFLQLCFRQLVAERTRRDGVRPDGPTLRGRILAEQVHGLDVMEGALLLPPWPCI